MKSVSRVSGEMTLKVYTNIENIERNVKEYQYLVFKQSEKHELLKHKFTNVLTIQVSRKTGRQYSSR